MIYLDVTSACLSPLNTGVKRMQRFLHEQLRGCDDYQPVVWQSLLRAYRATTPRDLQFLESKWLGSLTGWQLYDSFLPGLWRDLRELLSDRSRVMGWPAALTQGDLILVPDLLWDNRGEFFTQDFPTGVKRVGVFHDAISITHPGQSRIDATACTRGVRALSRFDGVVCLSQDARNDLLSCWKDLGCDSAPVTILPWPVPFSGGRPDSLPANDSREILYVARLEKRKNHLLLLDACEKLWREGLKFRLRLIGCKSYPLWTRKVLKRIQTLQQQERDLIWFPHVSDAVLHKSYQSAKFTVFPSRAEGFGLPILESLWHGRPVICDWQGAVGELASEGGCLMVDVSNAEKLAGSIRSLLDDPKTYEDLRQACLARRMFGWDDYWKSSRDFFKSL
jgi:glycosyltransferase involved in cell wall biosynthesis